MSLEQKRQHWFDADDNEFYASELRTAAAVYIAALEALSNTSICIFCGATMEKDMAVMLDHAKGCELRPENRLMLQIAELEAENARLKAQLDRIDPSRLVDRGEA